MNKNELKMKDIEGERGDGIEKIAGNSTDGYILWNQY